MACHLNLPWTWEECTDGSFCEKAAHLDMDSDLANNQPREWVKLLLGNCKLTEYVIVLLDDDGKAHNENGPAEETMSGAKRWKKHGVLHRLNGPATVDSQRSGWYVDGKFHRTDGPALEYFDGRKRWYIHGVRHRTDGPAMINANGQHKWYVDGVFQPEPEMLS